METPLQNNFQTTAEELENDQSSTSINPPSLNLSPEQNARIKEILDHPSEANQKKSSVGWTIFWLIAFTPIGWYFVVKKTTWPVWVKVLVVTATSAILIGLAAETEFIVFQVSSALGGSGINSLLQ
jgi:hypothetical protein